MTISDRKAKHVLHFVSSNALKEGTSRNPAQHPSKAIRQAFALLNLSAVRMTISSLFNLIQFNQHTVVDFDHWLLCLLQHPTFFSLFLILLTSKYIYILSCFSPTFMPPPPPLPPY